MSTKPKAKKAPKLFLTTGADAVIHRKRLALNQSDFWARVAVRQSGGSRYETGRKLPSTVQLLLHFAYAPDAQVQAMLSFLRGQDTTA